MTTADVEPRGEAAAGTSAEERPAGRLERLRTVERAWRLFVEDGADPAGVADEIARSWRRARGLGVDPAMRRITAHLGADELAERRERDEILRLARPILEDFARRLERGDQVLAYCDADGFMLSVDGAPGAVASVEEIDFRPGACWAEAAAGTNGPGTALAEARPVEVFAAEHFVRAWQPWSCAAAPILAPGLATPVGVVDLTGPWARQRRQALIAAQAIARAIEERLRAAASVRDEVVRYAFRAAHASGDALVAVDGRGTVVAVNDAAARRRVVEAGALPAPVLAALRRALAGRELAEARELRLDAPGGPGLVVSPVTHERTVVGAILRAPLEARPGRRARAAGAARPPPAVAPARYDFGRILGGSDTLAAAVDMARVASRNALPVVLAGESGTGKELFAHAIHADSDRRDGPFVAVNCGSIPSQLLEAELFGYEPGTFTGGRSDGNPGRFEDAHGGTLFLDEVSELSGAAQTALLRVVQEREVVRLGGSAARPIDVRIVAATNKPLEEEIHAGRFRRDLYYRLNVLAIEVPPLRARGDDLVLLARIFLADAEADVGRAGLSLTPAAVEAIRAHGWPGNVRELKNVMLRAAATARAAAIEPWELRLDAPLPRADPGGAGPPGGAAPGALAGSPASPRGGEREVAPGGEEPGGASPPAVDRPLRSAILDSEREIILAALGASGWNFSRTARRLGISRMTLYRRLRRCGISRTGRPG